MFFAARVTLVAVLLAAAQQALAVCASGQMG